MDDEQQLTRLLTRAADSAGPFEPMAVDELSMRRRTRNTALRPMLAVAATVAVVAGLGVGLNTIGHDNGARHTDSHRQVQAAANVGLSDLKKYAWKSLPPTPISTDPDEVSQWTGKQILVVGSNGGFASYSPSARKWTKLAKGPKLRTFTTSVWDGKSLYVWTWAGDRSPLEPGARYDVATNRWRRVATLPPGTSYDPQSAAVLGGRIVAVRYADSSEKVGELSAYDPSADRWTNLTTFRALREDQRFRTLAITTIGGEAVILGGMERYDAKRKSSYYEPRQLYRYAPGGRVRPLTTLPYADDADSIYPAGDRVLLPSVSIGGPDADHFSAANDLVDLDGKISRTPRLGMYVANEVGAGGKIGSAVLGNGLVWTGRALLAAEEGGKGIVQVWQPGQTKWTVLAGKTARTDMNGDAVWTGDRLIVLARAAAGTRGQEFAPR